MHRIFSSITPENYSDCARFGALTQVAAVEAYDFECFCLDKNAIKRQYNMRRVKLSPFDTFLFIHCVALSLQNTESAVSG